MIWPWLFLEWLAGGLDATEALSLGLLVLLPVAAWWGEMAPLRYMRPAPRGGFPPDAMI